VKEAKVIAMTCTHAALKRKELVDLGKLFCLVRVKQEKEYIYIYIEFDPIVKQNFSQK
jgi:hypothetical protein